MEEEKIAILGFIIMLVVTVLLLSILAICESSYNVNSGCAISVSGLKDTNRVSVSSLNDVNREI